MKNVPKTGMTARIRQHIAAIDGPFSTSVTARDLKIPNERFFRVIWAMRQRGEVEKVEGREGWYRYKKVALNSRPPGVTPRVLKAMHVAIRFSVR
jgi:hypothetical protein